MPTSLDRETCISDFNDAWILWFESLRTQMPEISFELESAITLLDAAAKYEFEKIMYNFHWYTINSLDKLVAHDVDFLDEMVEKASHSKYQLMPTTFRSSYDKLQPEQQKRIWGTLCYLASLTAQVYEDYAQELKNAQKHR